MHLGSDGWLSFYIAPSTGWGLRVAGPKYGGENHAEKYEGKRRADWLCGAKIGEWFGAKIVLILKCCAAAFPVGINSVTKCVLGGF